MEDRVRCSWWMGCSNPDVRAFWWFCGRCGERFRRITINRCDFHRPVLDEFTYTCTCIEDWWRYVAPEDGPQLYNPFSATALTDWLDA